ncbi:MAG: 50S ribosomal protein L25/general stress protein Ctc [Gammaproteobacteria bacterium]|nr:50S ribosomal protein L25/general stress protein Ctc [Gammaproteobacteria bacterium]
MAVNYQFDAEKREHAGTSVARKIRRDKKIPAVIYGGHADPEMLVLDHNEVEKKLMDEGYYSHILSINIDGQKPQQAIMKTIQRHPSKSRILHMDFMRITAGEKIKVTVPIHFLNEDKCIGVKQSGGSVLHTMNELEIICLPSELPESIDIDVADLDIGGAIHLTQIDLPDNVEIAALTHGDEQDYDQIIVSITPPRVVQDEVDAPEEAGEEGDEES